MSPLVRKDPEVSGGHVKVAAFGGARVSNCRIMDCHVVARQIRRDSRINQGHLVAVKAYGREEDRQR